MIKWGQFMELNLTRRLTKRLFLVALVSCICSVFIITFAQSMYTESDSTQNISTQNVGLNEEKNPQTVVYSMHVGKYVEIVSAGIRQVYRTDANTLADFFKEQGIRTPEQRELGNYKISDEVSNGMKLKITRIEDKYITKDITIHKSIIRIPSSKLLIGVSRLERAGRDGRRQDKYKVTYVNGVKASAKLIASNVVSKPINTVVNYGTQNVINLSRGGTIRIKKVFIMEATAYSTNGGGARTATGRAAVKGVVAVDPSVIPLGSKLFIESIDGTRDYGYAIAADTGGAIKGKKIDLCYNTTSECYVFGRRDVRVYILK